MLGHSQPRTFSVGDRCEGKAADGSWWPVKLTKKNSDGTFDAEVSDGQGTMWPSVCETNLRESQAAEREVTQALPEGWASSEIDSGKTFYYKKHETAQTQPWTGGGLRLC